jgi:Na+/proline symporter
VLMFPMFAAPLFVPGLEDPTTSYAEMTQLLLPPGMIGLVLAGMFSHTMAMVASDANAISSVITRDMLPVLWRKAREFTDFQRLRTGRIATFGFITLSMVVATQAQHLGGVLSIVVSWVAALMGPISVPLLLGMLPWFRRCGSRAAIVSWAGGLITYGVLYYGLDASQTATVATPILVSLLLYIGLGLVASERTPQIDEMLELLDRETAGDAPATSRA